MPKVVIYRNNIFKLMLEKEWKQLNDSYKLANAVVESARFLKITKELFCALSSNAGGYSTQRYLKELWSEQHGP